MARTFLTPIDLAQNELQNARIQNLAAAPASPVKGQLYFNSTVGDDTLYWYDGAAWVPAEGTDAATVDAQIDAKVDALTIVTVPTTSLTVVQSGSSATGDLTHTITLNSLTLANTYTGIVPPTPTTPVGEAGDLYIDTASGLAYINDGTAWLQLEAPAGGVGSVGAGVGIAVDSTTPSVPVVSALRDPAVTNDAALTITAAGIKLDPTAAGSTIATDADLAAAVAAIPPVVAGAGLTSTVPGTLDVVATAAGGLVVAADSVGVLVDPAVGNQLTVSATGLLVAAGAADPTIAHKFVAAAQALVANVGTVITHNLGVTPVAVQAYRAGALVDVDVTAMTTTAVTLTAAVAATVDVIVIG